MERTKISKIWLVLFAVVLCFGPVGLAGPVGTAFTYQGRLIDNNQPADGLYDFQFKLYDANSGGNKVGSDVNKGEVDVIDGYFTVELDFGSVFDGNNRWLEIGARPGIQSDPNTYAALTPRQKLTATPYALYAKTAGSGADFDWIITGNNMYSGVSGNVGIGTTTPSSPLTVKTVAGPTIELVSTGYNADIMSNGAFRVGTSTGQPFSIITNNFYQMTVDSAGKVGIGTTSPAAKLDVVGDINVASDYKIGGNTALSVSVDNNSINAFVGVGAGRSNSTGYCNTFSGPAAGYSNTTGYCNTFSGAWAGWWNTTGSGNVFLGNEAGHGETGSNKLYIANSHVNPPLIYGDFSAKYVGINTTTPTRNLHINDVMRLQPRASAPSSPAEGDIYMDSTTHKLMVYDGTAWRACW